jgi:pSer/pThr/pTyr-binding forkhead associated (FHA) protein
VTATSAPGHVEWVAEVWVDPDWYASQDVSEPCPSPGMPQVVAILDRTVLIGRLSTSRNIHPQIDLSSDSGVSRRHAQLSSDGQRWWVEDLQSANGTFVGAAGAPVPTTPIPVGQRMELADDDRIFLGAWTRVVVRRATPEEASLGS